jgi:hypothetical protein
MELGITCYKSKLGDHREGHVADLILKAVEGKSNTKLKPVFNEAPVAGNRSWTRKAGTLSLTVCGQVKCSKERQGCSRHQHNCSPRAG